MKRMKIEYEEIDFKEFTCVIDGLGEQKIKDLQAVHRSFFLRGYRGAVASVLMYALGKAEGERMANKNQQEKNALP